VQTFVGRWLQLPEDSLCRLGASPSSGTLGSTAIAGARIWTSQLHFRVRLGPVASVEEFDRLAGRLAELGVPDARLALE
jgi:type VI secretion system protein ImpH